MAILDRGSHVILYGLNAAVRFVAGEIAMSVAAGVAPFDADGPPSLTGNAIVICRDSQDAQQLDRGVEAYEHDRRHLIHACELGLPDDLPDLLKQHAPVALVVRDLSTYGQPYGPGVYGERSDWLAQAKEFAVRHGAAVVTAITTSAKYTPYPAYPGQPPRFRTVAQPFDLANYADTLLPFDDERFVLGEGADAIRLTRREGDHQKGSFSIVMAKHIPDPLVEIYTRQPTDDPRIHAMPPIRLKD